MFKLQIETGNAAFNPNPEEEISRILERLSRQVLRGQPSGIVFDENGNTVGRWEMIRED